jgi:hypothetical protein
MTEELEKMLQHTVEYATDLLQETGEAYPFGAYLDTIDNVHPLEMEIDTKNVPTIGKVIEGLTTYCTAEMEADKMNAYALAYEVQVQTEADAEPIDAIAIDMTHKTEKNVPLFYLPFTPGPNKTASVGELFGVKR